MKVVFTLTEGNNITKFSEVQDEWKVIITLSQTVLSHSYILYSRFYLLILPYSQVEIYVCVSGQAAIIAPDVEN